MGEPSPIKSLFEDLTGDSATISALTSLCKSLNSAFDRAAPIRRLSRRLHEMDGQDFVPIEEVAAALSTLPISKIEARIRPSVEAYLGRQVTDKLFVQHQQRLSPRRTTHMNMMSGLHRDLSAVVSMMFSRAFVGKPMSEAEIIAKLSAAWRLYVVPLVESESISMKAEADELSQFMIDLAKVKFALQTGVSAAHAALCAIGRAHHATIRRLRDSTTSRAKEDLFPRAAMQIPAVFEAWLDADGQSSKQLDALRLALLVDYRRLIKLSSEPPNSRVWYGFEMTDELLDSAGGLQIQPSIMCRFATESGRVFAKYLQNCRGLPTVQFFTVVRCLMQFQWFEVENLNVSYCLSVVDDLLYDVESVLRRATNAVIEFVYEVAQIVVSADQALAIAERMRKTRRSPSPTHDVVESSTEEAATFWPGDKLPDLLSLIRDPGFAPSPFHVHWLQLVDFFVLVELMRRLEVGIDQRIAQRPYNFRDVIVGLTGIEAFVSRSLASIAAEPENASIRGSLENLAHSRLDVRVCSVVKRLITSTVQAHAATRKAFCFDLRISFEVEHKKTQHVVVFNGRQTKSMYLLHNSAVRVCGFLAEYWPLPSHFPWTLTKLPRLRDGQSTAR